MFRLSLFLVYFMSSPLVSFGLPVTSKGDVFNPHFTSVLPEVEHDWYAPDFPEQEAFLNSIPQTIFGFGPGFPMHEDVFGQVQKSNGFSISLMNSTWSGPSETNVFHSGDILHIQLSAIPGPGQQLYVQSCHVSSSSDNADNFEVPLVVNKGCVSSKETLVEFVLQHMDHVNLIIHASSLKSRENFLHCKVKLSDSGLTSVTKFCNYDKLKSKWVYLDGQTSVCECCTEMCKSSTQKTELPISLDLTAVVSTGPLIIEDELPAPNTTSLADSSSESRILAEKEMEVDTLSRRSEQRLNHVSSWPIQPAFGGGVMVISQGRRQDLSLLLPNVFGFRLNPVVQFGIGPLSHPSAAAGFQVPVRKPNTEETLLKDGVAFMDESEDETNNLPILEDGDMWYLDDEPSEEGTVEQPHLNFETVFNYPLNDQPAASPTSGDVPTLKDADGSKGEFVFRQAEMVFKKAKETELSGPVFLSKLSLSQAADGSSSLNYEEERRPSNSTPIHNTSQVIGEDQKPHDGAKPVYKIKELISSLLNILRELWTK